MIVKRMLFTLTALAVSLSTVASDLVVVVNKLNPMQSLTKSEVIDIYMGRYLTFPDGSPVQPLDLKSNSKLKENFYLTLVNQNGRKVNAYWSRLLFSGRATPPLEVSSVAEALQQVIEAKSKMAYIPQSAVTNSVRVVFKFDQN
jgi:hypothetical protein